MDDGNIDIKIVVSDDGTITWLQMKTRDGSKLDPDTFLMELEEYIHEVSIAQAEKAQAIDQ